MQMGRQYIPYAASFDHIFAKTMKKNRVELASDFPQENDAEVISSLQIHPQGWCALSRNISYDESSEWTCVHDIQEWECDEDADNEDDEDLEQNYDDTDDEDDDEDDRGGGGATNNDHRRRRRVAVRQNQRQQQRQLKKQRMSSKSQRGTATTAAGGGGSSSFTNRHNRRPPPPTTTSDNTSSATQTESSTATSTGPPVPLAAAIATAIADIQPTPPDIWAAEVTVRDRMLGNRRRNSTGTFGNTHVYGISSGVLLAGLASGEINVLFSQPAAATMTAQTDARTEQPHRSNGGDEFPNPAAAAAASAATTVSAHGGRQPQPVYIGGTSSNSRGSNVGEKSINQNLRRMLKYIEEPNKGKGFIKELCFSSDGRIICSPYGCGFRLLGFSGDCSELPRTLHPFGEAQPLVALKYIKCHTDIVVSTKFSPRQPLFASGCLRGRVVWHQPKF